MTLLLLSSHVTDCLTVCAPFCGVHLACGCSGLRQISRTPSTANRSPMHFVLFLTSVRGLHQLGEIFRVLASVLCDVAGAASTARPPFLSQSILPNKQWANAPLPQYQLKLAAILTARSDRAHRHLFAGRAISLSLASQQPTTRDSGLSCPAFAPTSRIATRSQHLPTQRPAPLYSLRSLAKGSSATYPGCTHLSSASGLGSTSARRSTLSVVSVSVHCQ